MLTTADGQRNSDINVLFKVTKVADGITEHIKHWEAKGEGR